MNDLIEKIDQFLNERENKEKYMIYGSILIVFIIICYYFNFNYLYNTKIKTAKSELTKVKKNYNLSHYKRELVKKRNRYLNLSNELKNIKKDLKKINNLILSSKNPKLIVTKDDLFKYLKDVFNFSINKYIFPSYEINESKNDLVTYNIFFKGRTSFNNFKNFILFIKYMENNDFISTFSRIEFNVSRYGNIDMSDFNGSIIIWSYK